MTRTRSMFRIGLFAALLAAGCSSRPQQNEDFVPADDTARAALEASLLAWQRGNTAQEVPGTSPQVFVVDEVRAKGRRLTGYKILGPVPADAPLCFAVQLSFADPPAEVRERYVVVGLDPLWVWRYDDHVMINHWCHPVDPKAPAKK